MRQLKHPGAGTEPRRIVQPREAGGSLRLKLSEGADLLTGLTEALVRRGITDAGLQLLAGAFSEMQYLTGQPDDILGQDSAGKPLLHCHAVVVDREGRIHGGHLPPNVCKLGPAGVTALVTVIDGAGFQVSYDAETNYDIFQPTGEQAA